MAPRVPQKSPKPPPTRKKAATRPTRKTPTKKKAPATKKKAPAKKRQAGNLREPAPPAARPTRRTTTGNNTKRLNNPIPGERRAPTQDRFEIDKASRDKVMAPVEQARADADRQRRLEGLPTVRSIERTRQMEEQRQRDDARRRQEITQRNDPFSRISQINRNAVDCRDCHPDRQPSLRLNNDDYQRLMGPRPISDADARAETQRRFDRGAAGLDPSQRGKLADDYSQKLAGAPPDPTARSRERDRTQQGERTANDLRMREAERLRQSAETASPEQAEALRRQADDLVRRPLTPAGDQFLSALERTPTERLSKNDVDDGMAMLRQHRAADHDTYNRNTGLQPGHEDMFITPEQQRRMFDATPIPDLTLDTARLRNLNSKNCMDCHPDPPDLGGFDLSDFGKRKPLSFDQLTREREAPRQPTERERVGNVIDAHLAGNPRFANMDRNSAEYRAEHDRLRAEHEQLQRIRSDPSNPTHRLRGDRESLTPEQQRVLADHEAAHRYNNLERKLQGPQRTLAEEYKRNGWGEDSRFYGANDAAFLADLSQKDPTKISRHDAFRGLAKIDEFRTNNPEVFQRHEGDFASRANGSDLYYRDVADIRRSYDQQIAEAERTLPPREAAARKAELERQFDARRKAIGDDRNNPFGYLKTPLSELEDAQADIVRGDYTRHQVEKLQGTLRAQTVNGLADEVTKLDRSFERILDHQGIIGGGANWMKNHIGSDGGWIVDSNLGSDAVERTIQDAHVAADRVRDLANFRGTNEEFLEAYRDRVGAMHDGLRGVERHIGKFERSQENWVEGVSTAVSVVGAAAAAAATGGTAAPLLVGALAGAGLKVGTKGIDAFTGGHDYQGNVGIDLLKGGLNGVSAAGTGMLAQKASQSLLASATARLGAGQTLGLGTRGGIWLGTAAGEGALDGYIAGTGNALIDGKSLGEANREGLQGLALGAALGPVARGSMEGLGFLWKSAVRPNGLPKDIPIDWRGRPIGADGQPIPMKKDWRGRYTLDTDPTTTTGTRTGAPDTTPNAGGRNPALDDTVDMPMPPPPRPTAPIDQTPRPYEALPAATGKPTAEHLPVRVDGYTQVHDPNFTRGMANAIGEAETTLRQLADANGGKVTPQQVHDVLNTVGQRRRELQHAKIDRQIAEDAAAGRPWTQDMIDKARKEADMYGAPLPDMRATGGNQMVDQVLHQNRHAAYVDRAQDTMAVHQANNYNNRINVDVNGTPTEVPLSGVMNNPWHADGYLTVHPDFDQSRVLSNRAYELMADVINDTTLTEAQAFRKMAEANYLMMHGTPFQLGSPASIEAMNDAVMRMRFGKTMPPKRPGVEPFWEAMFAKPGQEGLDQFVNVYRQFFEAP